MLQDVTWDYDKTVNHFQIHDIFHDLGENILGEDLVVVNDFNFSVSDSSRYLAWRLRSVSPDEEFPEKLKAKNARSFMYQCYITSVSMSFIRGIISYMPRFRILSLLGCQFEELPSTIGSIKHLRVLEMSHNYVIRSLPSTVCDLLNLEYLGLHNCKQLAELPSEIYKLISLRVIRWTTSQKSLAGTKFNRLPSLRHMYISFCERLESLWDSDDVEYLGSLQCLRIYDCPRVTSLPNSMKLLVGLDEFVIMNCENLDFERRDALSGLHNLRTLRIEGVPSMSFLPNDIRSAANSLIYLYVENCSGLIGLATCFESFTSLVELHISNCPNLLSLPEGIRHVKSLLALIIEMCPHLARRCATPDGEDLSLIRHVPHVMIDGCWLTQESRHAFTN